MTSTQYYKQTSDMAYPLNNFLYKADAPNTIVAYVTLTHGETSADALKILKENDFFSLPADFTDKYNIYLDTAKFQIHFHYGLDNFDCYDVDIVDIIDCTCVDGGRIVLSCNGYKLIQSVRPKKFETAKSVDDSKCAAQAEHKSIFDIFDDIIGCSSSLKDLFSVPAFPKFPEISKMIEDTRKNIEAGIEKSKADGNAKFYNFSCQINPDGKVYIKRSSNDGTIEKEFRIGDNASDAPKNVEIQDDRKTELKNLIN